MKVTCRQLSETRWRLSGLQRTDRLPCPPGTEHPQNEFCGNALRIDNGIDSSRAAFRLRVQLAEGPLPTAGEVAQREFVAVLPRDLSPAFVKHCQFGSAAIASAASANDKSNNGRPTLEQRTPRTVAAHWDHEPWRSSVSAE